MLQNAGSMIPMAFHGGTALRFLYAISTLVLRKILSFNWFHRFPRLALIRADGGYSGELFAWAPSFGNWILDIVRKDPDQHTFVVFPRRVKP